MTPPRRPVRILADDLTGAADSGIAFAAAGAPVSLAFARSDGRWADPDLPAVAVDADTRSLGADAAYEAAAALAAAAPPDAEIFKKVDSRLRGNLGAECDAVQSVHPDRLLVVAPAFPRLGRTTRDGSQRVGADVVPIAGLVEGDPVPLAAVRGDDDRLRELFAASALRRRAVLCDAETDADLDRIVRAAQDSGAQPTWVGAGGLAAALGRARGGAPPSDSDGMPAGARVLAVVGSRAPVARRQASAIAAEHVEADARALARGDAAGNRRAVADAFARAASVVVTVSEEALPHESQRIASSLARAVAPAAMAASVLVLSGGATARAVLEACGCDALELLAEPEPGVVVAQAAGLRPRVVTKSGGFGDEETLVRVLARLVGGKQRV